MKYIIMKECFAKLDEVAKLNESTPNGYIVDADTILADVMEEANFDESGMFEELRRLYHDAYMDTDESKVGLEIFHEMFNLFTGISFTEYLDCCKENITRGENND